MALTTRPAPPETEEQSTPARVPRRVFSKDRREYLHVGFPDWGLVPRQALGTAEQRRAIVPEEDMRDLGSVVPERLDGIILDAEVLPVLGDYEVRVPRCRRRQFVPLALSEFDQCS